MAHQYIAEGNYIDYTPGSAVTAGDVIVLGSNICAVAPRDIASGALGSLATRGEWELTKLAGEAWTQGNKIYWDAGNSRCTTTASTHKQIGVASASALSAATVGRVLLNVGI